MPLHIDLKALGRLLATIDDEWTTGLNQNGDVLSNARSSRDAAAKIAKAIGPEHPAYAEAMLAHQCALNILSLETAEDLRQKGISGLWEKYLPAFKAVIAFYEAHGAGRETV